MEMAPGWTAILSPCAVESKSSVGTVATWRGQLKLDVYRNSGLLTVHVIEGRHFSVNPNNDSQSDGTFVRISRANSNNRTCSELMQTGVKFGGSPVFDEKVTIETSGVEKSHRLLISVWRTSRSNKSAKPLGCLSFGLRGAVSKRRSGWFHLLSEEIGSQKHVRAMESRSYRPQPRRQSFLQSVEPEQPIKMYMSRGVRGFGFCLTSDGSGPIQVSLVDPSGPASSAGVCAGDFVVAVNGEDVRSLSQDTVLRRIRSCPSRLALSVVRRPPSSPTRLYENVFGDDADEGFDSGPALPPRAPKTPPSASWSRQARRAALRRILTLEEDLVWRREVDEADGELERQVEQLVEISRSHLNQMVASADFGANEGAGDVEDIRNIGQIYRYRIHDLCRVYRTYSEALQRKQERETRGTATVEESSLSLIRNLYRPLDHLNSLLKDLRVVLSHTESHDPDWSPLSFVVSRMEVCCRSVFPQMASPEAASVTTDSSPLPSDLSSSVDSELLRLQQRLHFVPPLETVNLCAPQRHLIFSSDLFMVSSRPATFRRVFVLLLNDTVLVTEPSDDEVLSVLFPPLPLQHASAANFSNIGSHFSISFTEPLRHIEFRAPTYELKVVWKNLLLQRMELCSGLLC